MSATTEFATMEQSLEFWQKLLELQKLYGPSVLQLIAETERNLERLTNQKARDELGAILRKLHQEKALLFTEPSREEMDRPVPMYKVRGIPVLENQLKIHHAIVKPNERKSRK